MLLYWARPTTATVFFMDPVLHCFVGVAPEYLIEQAMVILKQIFNSISRLQNIETMNKSTKTTMLVFTCFFSYCT